MKDFIFSIPFLGGFFRRVRNLQPEFPGSRNYWERRYASGRDSGAGSYGEFAKFKAEILNAFVAKHGVQSVIEFGCGDGNQLLLAQYASYLGFDVSETAVRKCRKLFAGDVDKRFEFMSAYHGQQAELALSLDVVYHLVEDEVFERYMRALFDSATRYVIIYSSNSDVNDGRNEHVRHRRFSSWVQQNIPRWKLRERIPNKFPFASDHKSGSFAEFFIYEID